MYPTTRHNNWLPDVFNDFFNVGLLPKNNATAPSINVMENDTQYTVEVAAPGMTKEDFNVHINSTGDLVIKMEHKEEKKEKKEEDKNVHYLRREFSYAQFEQTLILPDDVDKAKIGARVADGVLTIDLPKLAKEEVKVERHIEIG